VYYYGSVASVTDGTGATTSYTYSDWCATGQCLATNAAQQTTITYPAQVPCPSCSAVWPVEVDNYVGGIESSTQLGSTTNAYNNETWSYNWTLGYGAANSTELITYPKSVSGATVTATITLDPAGNVIQTENALGDYATSDYNDVGGNDTPELMWSYPGNATTPGTAPSGSEVYTYNTDAQVVTAADPLGNVTKYGYYQYGSALCYVAPPTVSISGAPPTCSGNGTGGPGSVAPVGSTAYTYDAYGDLVAESVDFDDTASGSDPQTWTASYNIMGDQLWGIPPAGQSGSQSSSNPYATVTTYTPSNQTLTVTPPGQGTTTNTYDAALNLVKSVTPASTTTRIYDNDNRVCYQVVQSSSPWGLTCSSGNTGGSTAYTYVPGSTNIASTTDSNLLTTAYYYGDLAYPNSPTEVVDPASEAIQYTAYNDFGNVCVSGDISLASQQGTSSQCSTVSGDTSTIYNALGDETSITDPSGNTTTNAFTDTSYPTLETSSTNALSKVTSYGYDADGDLVTTTNPDTTSIHTAYDSDSRVCTQSSNGTAYGCGAGSGVAGVTAYTYNGASDRTAMTSYSPSAATTTYSYVNGQLTGTTDSNGKTISYVYNYDGQVACEAYPVDVTSGCGTFTSLGTGSSTNTIVKDTYDSAGRLGTVTDWLGKTTTYTYGDGSNPTVPTEIAYPTSTGVTANYGFDNDNNLTSLTAGTSGTTSINDTWRYDDDERTAVTTVNGVASSWTDYNADNQTTNATNLATSTSNDAYTIAANGEITKDVPPSGTTYSYGYNAGDELCTVTAGSSATACGSSPSTGTKYTYTSNGQRATATPYTSGTAGSVTDYAWNPYGELCNAASSSTACGSTPTSGTSYAYNGDGLRTTSATTSGGSTGTISTVGSLQQAEGTGISTLSVSPVNVGDALVLAAKVKDVSVTIYSVSGGGATWQKLTNAGSNPDIELWLGTVTTAGSSTITVSYSGSVTSDAIELDAQEYTNGTGSSTTWTKDVVGSSNNTSSSTTVTFPTLTPSASHELYVGFARVPNTGLAGSTSGFTYDVTEPNANLYIYNPNVSSAVSPTGAETPAGTSIAVGALIAASGSTSPATTTDSTWDVVSGGSVPLNINDATTTSGVTTNTSYIYGDLLDGGTAPIEQIKTTSSGATEVYLVANQTGVQGVFSSAGGLDELALYTLYGRQTIVSGTDVTPFGFQGSYTDSTGLIYLINRYYDPTTDQFLSIDPDAATTDQPYVFTNDDPLNSTDPLGLSPHGDRNVEDTEFIGISTEQLQKEYDALKGNLTPEQKAYKQRLKTTLKGRGARPSSAQKFISVFQAPLTSTENFMSTINNEMQSPAMKVEETAAGGAIVVWLGYLALGALL
jgi:RHS repeat-associated protein